MVDAAITANGAVLAMFGRPQRSPGHGKSGMLRDRNGSPRGYEEATWGVPQHSTVIWRRSFAMIEEVGNQA